MYVVTLCSDGTFNVSGFGLLKGCDRRYLTHQHSDRDENVQLAHLLSLPLSTYSSC